MGAVFYDQSQSDHARHLSTSRAWPVLDGVPYDVPATQTFSTLLGKNAGSWNVEPVGDRGGLETARDRDLPWRGWSAVREI